MRIGMALVVVISKRLKLQCVLLGLLEWNLHGLAKERKILLNRWPRGIVDFYDLFIREYKYEILKYSWRKDNPGILQPQPCLP